MPTLLTHQAARTLTAAATFMLALAALSNAHAATNTLPAEVAAFVHHRNACDAWRAETSTDAVRQLQIEDGVCRKCVGKDARLDTLRKRYANEANIALTLNGYPSPIEVLPVKQAIKRCLPIHYRLIRHNKAHPQQAALIPQG